MKQDASSDIVKARIKQMNKQIEAWSMQVEDLQMEIEKLNRWINFEQSDLDEANEMLINMQELDREAE